MYCKGHMYAYSQQVSDKPDPAALKRNYISHIRIEHVTYKPHSTSCTNIHH